MQSKTSALVVVAAVALTSVIVFRPNAPQSIVAHDAQEAVVSTGPSATAPSVDTTRIVPADVLGTGVVSWAPLTGDGSN